MDAVAQFADLPAEMQEVVRLFSGVYFRPAIGQAARSLNALEALHSAYVSSGAKDTLAALPGDCLIPDKTDLAGARQLTAAEILATMTAAEDLLAGHNGPMQRAAYAKIAGLNIG